MAAGTVLTSTACLKFDAFACSSHAQCDLEAMGGICQPNGFCSYPDPACPSQQRFDEHAGDGLGGQCVGAGSATSTATDSSSGPDTDSDPSAATETSTSGSSDPTIDPSNTSGETTGSSCGGAGESCCEEPEEACQPGLTCLSGQCGCVASIASGRRHNCLITLDGNLMCWGANDLGQLGSTDTPFETAPVEVSPAFGGAGMMALQVSATTQTCALREDGVAYCWGNNAVGQASPLDLQNPLQPTSTAGFAPTATGVATGGTFSCLARDGDLAMTCFGDNTSGQLTGADPGPGPVDVPAIFEFTELELGESHGCGRTATGEMYCWGSNTYGQLGVDPATTPSSSTLVPVPLPPVGDLAVGQYHTCARVSDAVHCWGRNDVGQLGNDTQVDTFDPATTALLPAGVGVASLVAGTNHTCTGLIGGGLLCWGSNDRGQLLLEQDENGFDGWTLLPVEVEVGAVVEQVSAGATHTCVLTDGGQVLCWGANTEGQIGNGQTSLQVFEPTAVEVTCP